MNIEQKRKILQRIAILENDIETLKRVRVEIASSGYASASLGSGGGSKSYTRMNLNDITQTINELNTELQGLRQLLGNVSPAQPKTIVHIYF